jgi:hypothetical protein
MGALALLVGDPIPVSQSVDGLYQLAVPENNSTMSKLALEEKVPFLNLGIELPLSQDIRVSDKYLNAAGQNKEADLLFVALEKQGLIKALLAKYR